MHNPPSALSAQTAIEEGIKSVGVGKKGSRPLSRELAQNILKDLSAGKVSAVQRAAFFAALATKGLTTDEEILAGHFRPGVFSDPYQLASALCANAPESIKRICGDLLSHKQLDRATAYQLGKFLLSDQPSDAARALAAIVLRVRYETADEYDGILQSIRETFQPAFQDLPPAGQPVIQLAEPFDGVDHSYMITPCLARHLVKANYRVVSLIGRNSGPKYGNNLYDLVQRLLLPLLTTNRDLTDPVPSCGWQLDQKDLSPALDRWVDIRRQIIKRPFLATLEKFVDPFRAHILITSAFHIVYGQKMIDIAQRAGFPGVIVVRNGIEGTLAFPLSRPAKLLCAARKENGEYLLKDMAFSAQDVLGQEIHQETKLDQPSLTTNIALIREHLQTGQSRDEEFNHRVQFTCAGITRALDWIKENTQ